MKDKMNEACWATTNALHVLLDQSKGEKNRKTSMGGVEPPDLDTARVTLQRRSIELSKLVRDCLAGSIADTFLRTDAPLVSLIEVCCKI